MGDRSKIEWTESTWNPVTGCTPVSAGCANCYAKREHDRRHKAHLAGKKMAPQYAEPFEKVQLHPDRLDQPLRWRKPRRIFVCSGSDLFHEDVPIEFLAEIFDRMACATLSCGKRHEHEDECWTGDPHTFILLTKRPERMRWALTEGILNYAGKHWAGDSPLCVAAEVGAWPLPNVHVGVSVEDQATADERIPLLLATPAAVRFVSYEPALGPLDLQETLGLVRNANIGWTPWTTYQKARRGELLDGVICGGESGPNARPMHPDWARSVRDQCAAAGVSFFFKQWGAWLPGEGEKGSLYDWQDGTLANALRSGADQVHTWKDARGRSTGTISNRVGKKAAGRVLDGRTHDSLPGEAVSQGRSRGLPRGKLLTVEPTK